jgi:hypothetical protein
MARSCFCRRISRIVQALGKLASTPTAAVTINTPRAGWPSVFLSLLKSRDRENCFVCLWHEADIAAPVIYVHFLVYRVCFGSKADVTPRIGMSAVTSYLLDTTLKQCCLQHCPFSGCYPAIGRTCAQCASKTGSVAAAITCWVAPPNTICLNRL